MSQTASSTSSRSLLLALCLMLGSCGFHAVYAKSEANDAVNDKLAEVRVEPVESREGNFLKAEEQGHALLPRRDEQVMQNDLAGLLNPSGGTGIAPVYSVKINLRLERRDLGIRGDLRVTRYDIIGEATYQLIEIATNKQIDSGTVKTKSSFNRTDSEYSTFVAEQYSDEQAARELAQEIKERLIYDFSK